MMKININQYLLVVIFLLTTNAAFSQSNIPGYQGKRAMLSVNANVPITAHTYIGDIDIITSLNFNYITGRRAQIGVSYDFINHKQRRHANNVSKDLDDYTKLTGRAYGFNVDWYRKELLAPIGRYFRLEVKYVEAKHEDYNISVDDNGVKTETIREGETVLVAAGIGYGVRRVFKRRFVFNVGGTIYVPYELTSEGYSPRFDLGRNYTYKVNIGLGVLLF